jgi:hypothetical protein
LPDRSARVQAAAVAAADKADAARGESVKDAGVLPRVRALAADMADVTALLRRGLAALEWWWPWAAAVRRPLAPSHRR